jgi:hypothetical protein
VPFTKEDPADRINKFTGEPYQEQMNRLGFKDAGKVVGDIANKIFNNPGNIEEGQGFAGETGEVYASERRQEGKGAFVIFDTPEAGLRAVMRDIRSKIDDFDGDLLQMINKYAPPSDDNPTTEYYKYLRNKVGKDNVSYEDIRLLTEGILEFENSPTDKMTSEQKAAAKQRLTTYKNPEVLDKAEYLSQQEFPTGTSTKQMYEILCIM